METVGRVIGIGLMFILSGILMLLATAAAHAYPRLRLMEDELPDIAPGEAPPSP